MMNTNLLDLNNDILNIIGDYVNKNNSERILTDYHKTKDEKLRKQFLNMLPVN